MRYKGDVGTYLNEYFSVNKTPIERPYGCWRTKEGIPWCAGTREDITEMVISIPVILTIEITSEDDNDSAPWKFPSTIIPLDRTAAKDHKIIYDLVGYAVLTSERTHFIAKYISNDDGEKKIYTYDGMKHQGRPVKIDVANLNSDINAGEVIYQLFYYLRGGVGAQDMFVKLRAKELSQKYPLRFGNTDLSSPISIAYTAQDLKAMDPKERNWMIDPYNGKTSEYVSTTEPWEEGSPVRTTSHLISGIYYCLGFEVVRNPGTSDYICNDIDVVGRTSRFHTECQKWLSLTLLAASKPYGVREEIRGLAGTVLKRLDQPGKQVSIFLMAGI